MKEACKVRIFLKYNFACAISAYYILLPIKKLTI